MPMSDRQNWNWFATRLAADTMKRLNQMNTQSVCDGVPFLLPAERNQVHAFVEWLNQVCHELETNQRSRSTDHINLVTAETEAIHQGSRGIHTPLDFTAKSPPIMTPRADMFSFAPYYDSVAERLRALGRPVRVLEIGVFQGAGTHYLQSKLQGIEVEHHVCDVFRVHEPYHCDGLTQGDSFRPLFEDLLDSAGLSGKVIIHEGPSCQTVAALPSYYFDFIYIDASHAFKDVSVDILLSMKRLKPDGILGGHDLPLPDVKQALDKWGLTYTEQAGGGWEITSKIGLVYVSWGDEHTVNRTERSAWHSQLPTCLITDHETKWNEAAFGQVIRVDFGEYAGLHHFYRKMEAIKRTPFDLTMYLDGDTYPFGDLSLGFKKSAKHDFAAVIAPGQTFLWRDDEFVHYNCGVAFFKGRPLEWMERVMSHAPTFTESDEPAWSIAWDEMGINVATLPSVFNRVVAGPIHDRAVRVYHSRYAPKQWLIWPNDAH